MQVPRIQISSTFGQISLQSSRPHMTIKQPNADLSIKQNHSTLKISTEASKLLIDQTEAFADANLKSPLRSSNEFIEKTKSEVFQYIAKTAQQGDQLMRIENGFDVIPRLAAANSELYPERELNLGVMPKPHSVKFDYQPGSVKLDVASGEPEISVKKNDPQITIPKWKTEAYVKQKNNITIQPVGLNVNKQL